MIFSNFLKKKWQSKNEQVRISAIEDLDSVEDREVLLTLLKQDESAKVRIAVLEKLDDLSLWLLALKGSEFKAVKKLAQSVIEMHLLDPSHNREISTEDKFQIVDDINSIRFFEQWLAIENKTNVIITLLEKINKPIVLNRYFAKSKDKDVLTYIIERENSFTELLKLKKQTTQPEIVELLKSKIDVIESSNISKGDLTKQVQLVLAKLLKLTECNDHLLFIKKFDTLEQEWQGLTNHFELLPVRETESYTVKYDAIKTRLQAVKYELNELAAQQKIADELNEQKIKQQTEINNALNILHDGVKQAIHENLVIDTELFYQEIGKVTEQINSSALAKSDTDAALRRLENIAGEAKLVDKIVTALELATQAIAKISQVALPKDLVGFNDKYSLFLDLQSTWKNSVEPFVSYVPDALVEAKKTIVEQWQQAVGPLLKLQKQKLNKAKGKLRDVNQLIDNGKFNSAFGVYKSAIRLVDELSEQQKSYLEKEISQTKDRLDDISDWEHYVATPKKIELLALVSELVENPLADLGKQAKQVKQYRNQWNSLGHADTDKEKELNEAFNLACEDAFSPCRSFFALQETKRESNLAQRKALILSVKEFTANKLASTSEKALAQNLKSYTQQWKTCGEVDHSVFNDINNEYRNAMKPLRDTLSQLQEANASEKERLIEEAKALLSIDVQLAVKQVKLLQQTWKEVGFAGSNKDNALWKSFREVNDEIFQKRSDAKEANKNASELLISKYQKVLDDYHASIKKADDLQSLESLLSGLRVTLSELKNEEIQVSALTNSYQKFEKQLQLRLQDKKVKSHRQNLKTIFSVLEQLVISKSDVTDISDYKNLSSDWQKELSNVIYDDGSSVDRIKETIALEIFLKADTPLNELEVRRQVQVDMMQAQLSGAKQFTEEELIVLWIKKGAFNADSTEHLNRVKMLFN